MYTIEVTPRARADLQWFKKHEQNAILDGIRYQLRDQPLVQTRNRKLLRPNPTAEWELRLGAFRVFYTVEQQVTIVTIVRIGEKRGNAVYFRGQEEPL